MLKTGAAVLSAVALMTSATAFAQGTAAPSAPAEPEVSNEDIMNVSIVCVATYDLVIANGQAGADAAKIKTARDLARSIYMEASGTDAAKADTDIVELGTALKEEIAKGTMKLDELHTTCDSLLMDDPEAAAPAA